MICLRLGARVLPTVPLLCSLCHVLAPTGLSFAFPLSPTCLVGFGSVRKCWNTWFACLLSLVFLCLLFVSLYLPFVFPMFPACVVSYLYLTSEASSVATGDIVAQFSSSLICLPLVFWACFLLVFHLFLRCLQVNALPLVVLQQKLSMIRDTSRPSDSTCFCLAFGVYAGLILLQELWRSFLNLCFLQKPYLDLRTLWAAWWGWGPLFCNFPNAAWKHPKPLPIYQRLSDLPPLYKLQVLPN